MLFENVTESKNQATTVSAIEKHKMMTKNKGNTSSNMISIGNGIKLGITTNKRYLL